MEELKENIADACGVMREIDYDLDDLEHDLAVLAERMGEPTVSHAEVVAELREDGCLSDRVERLWVEESERRYAAYKQGRLKGIPLEDFRCD